MPIKDEDALDRFRQGPCEFCGRRGRCHPHHLTSRGFGGGLRFDVPLNLMSLCPAHHQAFHDGDIDRSELIAIVAKREGLTPEQWWEALWKMRRDDRR
jgi:hypothetical protein